MKKIIINKILQLVLTCNTNCWLAFANHQQKYWSHHTVYDNEWAELFPIRFIKYYSHQTNNSYILYKKKKVHKCDTYTDKISAKELRFRHRKHTVVLAWLQR